MDNTRAILKNAFIDAQLVDYTVKQHTFSTEFETKMKRIIKYQKGILRLINTTGKRIACIILTALICLTTVACSIEEVREPIIEEIKKFYVNAKELLTGTAADEVAELFPNDVSKIIGTSYVSKSKNQYIIDDEETVTKFIKLLSETYWGEPVLDMLNQKLLLSPTVKKNIFIYQTVFIKKYWHLQTKNIYCITRK